MKLVKMLSAVALALTVLLVTPKIPQARVFMTGSVTGFGMDILPTANFTTDDWLNREGMFTITITNGDVKTVKFAQILIDISSGVYGTVLSGKLTVVGPRAPHKAFITELRPGQSFTVNNTMLNEDTEQMEGGDWSEEFKDEVLRVGSLPEGTYTMKFTLVGYYEKPDDPIEDEWEIVHTIEIKNPTPPELITPVDMADDVVTIPRFAWQRPLVSDYSDINNRTIDIFYNITLWRMFGEDGSVLSEEDAIVRIPIWQVTGWNTESIDFDPGTAWEELVPGRKYCWQVQAVDGTGRPISNINEGKSDVWQFTCQFSPPVINEPLSFFPLGFSWTPAQAGGGMVYYRVKVADNPDFAGGYEMDGIVMTSFKYPNDAPPLQLGTTYYIELQATDDSGIPIGEPSTISFTLPVSEVTLRSPADGSVVSSKTPRFAWDGTAPYYVVMVYDEQSDWNYISGPVEETSWTYDGEDLMPGKTYAWNVSPATEMGDPVGDSSDTWYFSIPPEGQVTLVSPVNEDVDSLFPTFVWNAVEPPGGQGTVQYNIIIEDENGGAIHSAAVTSTSYQYPQDAPALSNAARYYWSVNAELNNAEIGKRSERASFRTPLTEAGAAATATMEDIGNMVLTVLADYPQFGDFENKVLVSISDETGPITPSAFMELFDTFKIVKVSEK